MLLAACGLPSPTGRQPRFPQQGRACGIAAPAFLSRFAVGPDHAVLLLILLVSYLFGVLRIGTRDMLLLSAGVSGAYAAILFGRWPQSVPGGDLRLAFLNWAVLTAVLLFYSVMGGYISRLRHQLAENRNELEVALQRIEHLVSHDELTGVLNRRRLMEVLEREHARARRYGTPFSVCMVDLDQFKQI